MPKELSQNQDLSMVSTVPPITKTGLKITSDTIKHMTLEKLLKFDESNVMKVEYCPVHRSILNKISKSIKKYEDVMRFKEQFKVVKIIKEADAILLRARGELSGKHMKKIKSIEIFKLFLFIVFTRKNFFRIYLL